MGRFVAYYVKRYKYILTVKYAKYRPHRRQGHDTQLARAYISIAAILTAEKRAALDMSAVVLLEAEEL